ncbi:MAG TPA: hypothetical protein PKB10_02080, partial [Tepidisphaeraceae bacterium]|nr:hypothetical protein [Tepidisphaeraceae bacterium]
VLLAGLESYASHPRQLAFFNLAARSFSDPIALLGDSNLDWGQDLPELARWHREHPDVPIYLSYWGTADPAHYGIRYINASRGPQDGTRENFGGYMFGPAAIPYREPPPGQWAVLAISASHLQGIGIGPEVYEFLRVTKPLTVLGDSIYLFALGQPPP